MVCSSRESTRKSEGLRFHSRYSYSHRFVSSLWTSFLTYCFRYYLCLHFDSSFSVSMSVFQIIYSLRLGSCQLLPPFWSLLPLTFLLPGLLCFCFLPSLIFFFKVLCILKPTLTSIFSLPRCNPVQWWCAIAMYFSSCPSSLASPCSHLIFSEDPSFLSELFTLSEFPHCPDNRKKDKGVEKSVLFNL